MSALALILNSQGYMVQGSDLTKSEFTQACKNKNIKVFIGHKQEHVLGADIVVCNSAIDKENPELLFAKKNKIQILSRAEILQEVSKNYQNVIAISGAHGKTTTTGMLTEIFALAGLKPTSHIGGILKSVKSNYVLGENNFFITEACEYKDNFLLLNPKVGVILNVEPEHLDYFGSYENVVKSFQKFADNSEHVVMYQKVPIQHKHTIIYGQNGYNARRLKQMKDGKYRFDCYIDNKKLFRARLNVVGKHNIYNALASIAVSRHFGIKDKFIKTALKNFSGISRRYDIKKSNPFIVHDYAHHPSELKSVIEATKNFKKGKIYVVFQPHTYTRTLSLMNDFLYCFDGIDHLCIIKTYSAREKFIAKGSAKTLYDNLKKRILNSDYFPTFNACYNFLSKTIKPKDTVLILGAGDIEKLADKFKQ